MTVTFFFLDRTFINRPKELRWAATTIGKLPTWFCCSASLHFFLHYDTTGLFIFCRYIDDGFMLTDKNSITDHITHLSSTYPSQIPITFTTNCHSTHYLDLTISLNYHTIMYHKIHHHIYQKPHHKYMYPHLSSNHCLPASITNLSSFPTFKNKVLEFLLK